MVFLSKNYSEINNELSAILRLARTHYRNEIKIQIKDVISLREFKLKVLRRDAGFYKFLFMVKIPRGYPCEPLWLEPIVICKQMSTQFSEEDFKSYKLRPLIDNVLLFCQKFDSVAPQKLIISFPSTNVASKVFVLIKKAIAKIGKPRSRFALKHANRRLYEKAKVMDGHGYYNDMGIDIVNYLKMFEKYRSKPIKYSYLKSRPSKSLYRRNQLWRLKLRKGISEVPLKVRLAIHCRNLTDIHYCKMNFSTVRNIITSLLMIPDGINNMDFQDNLTVEIGENVRIDLRMMHEVLVVRRASYVDFMTIVNSSLTRSESPRSNVLNKGCSSLLPLHSRHIISMDMYNLSMKILIHAFHFNQQQNSVQINLEEEELETLLETDVGSDLHAPVFLMVFEISKSLVVELEEEISLEYINILPETEPTLMSSQDSTFRKFASHQTIQNKFISEKKIFRTSLSLRGDLPVENNEISGIGSQAPLTKLCLDIMSEIIQYPKTWTDLFEYTLDINPKDDRHQTLIECIGILQENKASTFEILASSDYNLDYFFVKEIVNSSGDGFLIRLHKLPSKNIIFNLVKEENKYYKMLSTTNRALWCKARTTDFSFTLVGSVFNMANMYIGKVMRKKLLYTEASKLKCTTLPIRRCHFYKEFVDSLRILSKSQ